MSDVRQVLEEFHLHKVLKTSPQCTVFEASAPGDERVVVLKLINPPTPLPPIEASDRFDRFARRLRDARPVGVPTVLDSGLTPEHAAFLVLDAIDGQPLDALDDPSLARRVSIALELLGVVEAIAVAGEVHGNLSPDNVLVSSHGIGDRVVLLGLGTCAYLRGVRPEVWPIGSTAWAMLPPELERGIAEPVTDLWSVARLTCELLRLPVTGADGPQPRPMIPDPVGELLGEPEVLADVLADSLVRDPAIRRVTGSDLRDALIRAMPTDPNAELPPLDPTAMPEVGSWDRTVHIPVPALDALDVPDPGPEPDAAGFETTRFPAVGAPEPTRAPDLAEPEDGSDGDPYATTLRMPITEAMPVAPASADSGAARSGPEPSDTVLATPAAPAAEAERDRDVPRATPPPSPPPPHEGVPEPVPEPMPERSQPAGAGDPQPGRGGARVPWKPLVAIAGILILAAVVSLGLRSFGSRMTPEPTPTTAPPPTPIPQPTPVVESRPVVHPLLAVAQEELLEGDVEAARETIAQLSDERIAAFTDAEREIWAELEEGFTGADIDAAVTELRQGLQLGSMPMIRRSVGRLSSVTDEALDANPGLGGDLERARRVLRLHSAMWKASEEGDRLTVLDTAGELMAELPEYSGAPAKREQAAAELERRAEALIAERDYAAAVRVLESLRARWPDRAGVADRIAWCRSRMETEDEFRQLLDRARTAAREGDPERALEMLEGVQAPAALRGRLDEVRGAIRSELARLDADYPTVVIPDNIELEYRKNRSLTVPIRIVDDYRVARAVVLVRTESSPDFREIVLRESDDGVYPFHVGPDLHDNETVEFYVVATDRSGHETRLGGPEGPLTIERKRWFER